MYQDWVEYIKLSKDGLGLGRIYQVEEGWIKAGYIKLRKDESGLCQIYKV